MADQRRSFLRRLPWLSAEPSQRPKSEPQRSRPKSDGRSSPQKTGAQSAPSSSPASSPVPISFPSPAPSKSPATARRPQAPPGTASEPQKGTKGTPRRQSPTSQTASQPKPSGAAAEPQTGTRGTPGRQSPTTQTTSPPRPSGAAPKPQPDTKKTPKPQPPATEKTSQPKPSGVAAKPEPDAKKTPQPRSPATDETSQPKPPGAAPKPEPDAKRAPQPESPAAQPKPSGPAPKPVLDTTRAPQPQSLATETTDQPKPSGAAPQPVPDTKRTRQPQSPATQPTGQTASQPSSSAPPPVRAQPKVGDSTEPPESSSSQQLRSQESEKSTMKPVQPAISTAQQKEPAPLASHPLTEQPDSKVVISVEKSSTSQDTSPTKITSQPDDKVESKAAQGSSNKPAAPGTSIVTAESADLPKRLDPVASEGDIKPHVVSQSRLEESEDGKKVATEHVEEEKTSHGKPTQKTTATEHLREAIGTETKGPPKGTAFPVKKQLQPEDEAVDTKKKPPRFSSGEKLIKTVGSTRSQDRSTSGPFKGELNASEEAHAEFRKDISKQLQKLLSGYSGKTFTIITVAGDNKGASMNLTSASTENEGSIHIHRDYETSPEKQPEAATDGEVTSKISKHEDTILEGYTPVRAYISSNTQGVNNSLVFNSSISERNPGVHLELRQTSEQGKQDAKSQHLEAKKVEFMATPAEKLTFEPRVRRRCLRGLFMEPSDSDIPGKRRRHGCLYNRAEEDRVEH